ncbi:MAG: YceI family protein, partial [Myxococcota bacterium]
VFTANKKRDKHLRSPDFFSVKKFPKITFSSTSFKRVGKKRYMIRGKLNFHGVTKKVRIPFQLTGKGKDPWGNIRIGGYATFTIDRMAYGIKYMPKGLGRKVTLMVSLEAMRKAS